MNNDKTHSAVLHLPDNGIAFIDGIPDKCDHDYTGDEVYFTASGKAIYWHTYRQWASLTDSSYRGRLIHEYHQSIGDPITGGTVTCRKCKKIYSPDIFTI